MPLKTTVIGSMPKPDYLTLPCWVANGEYVKDFVTRHNEALNNYNEEELNFVLQRATKEAVTLQAEAGIDVITDGELRRDNYVFSFCRQLNGIDFIKLKKKIHRNGAVEDVLPRIFGKLSRNKENCLSVKEWEETSKLINLPVKMTIPGPMTIIDTLADDFYKAENERELFEDIVMCIQAEIEELCAVGCRHIQIDDPVLVRYPEKAMNIGIEMLNKCFSVVPKDVCTTLHVCCGYPQYLDQTDYKKSDLKAYIEVLSVLDNGNFNQLSIEDTHLRNPNKLFQAMKKKTIVLGVIDVVKSKIESVDEIKQHIQDVLEYIPKERLVIAPDCGLIYLPKDLMIMKLKNMVTAAQEL